MAPPKAGRGGKAVAKVARATTRPAPATGSPTTASPSNASFRQQAKRTRSKVEENDDDEVQTTRVRNPARQANGPTGLRGAFAKRGAARAAAATPSQPSARKQAMNRIIQHYTEPFDDSGTNSNSAASSGQAQRQVHYATLPTSLRTEQALRDFLKVFGKIVKVDMNYAPGGALVTFATPAFANKAMQGAMLANGRLLAGTHPTSTTQATGPAKKGRVLSQLEDELQPALGRHNMDDDEPEVPALRQARTPANNKSSRRQQQIEEDFDDDDETTSAPATSVKAKTSKKRQRGEIEDSYMAPAPNILERARSLTKRWNLPTQTKPTTFARFGTQSSAMDVDETMQTEDEEVQKENRAHQSSHFSDYDPTVGYSLSDNEAIGQGTSSKLPKPLDPQLVKTVSAKIKEREKAEELDEDVEPEDVDDDEEVPAAKPSKGGIFSHLKNTDDVSDYDDEEDENSEFDKEVAEEGQDDDDDAEHEEENDEEYDNEDDANGHFEHDYDEEQDMDDDQDEGLSEQASSAASRESPPPTISAPKPRLAPPPPPPRIKAKLPNFGAKVLAQTTSNKRYVPPRFDGSLQSLAQTMNPDAIIGRLDQLYDADKHIPAKIERNDPTRFVSSFQRPAGGDDIPPPERVRPAEVLYAAMEKIDENMEEGDSLLESYEYALDRYRQILKELTQQSSMCFLSCYIAEWMTRRALAMKAELWQNGFEPTTRFDTSREKVLDNAFEMCKNLYSFYTKRSLKTPFMYEIVSYYLLYRLRDGNKSALPTILDSLAVVFLPPYGTLDMIEKQNPLKHLHSEQEEAQGPRDVARQNSKFLGSLRQHPHIDFVTRVVDLTDTCNWTGLRELCKRASYLQLCSLADLMPSIIYFDMRVFATAYRSHDANAVTYIAPLDLQYTLMLRAEQVLDLFATISEDLISTQHVPPRAEDDDFYPPPSEDTPCFAFQQAVWTPLKDQVIQELTTLPPTFISLLSHIEAPIDASNALYVYLRWANQDLFNNAPGGDNAVVPFDDAAFFITDELMDAGDPGPLENFIIPADVNTLPPSLERLLERALAKASPNLAPGAGASAAKALPAATKGIAKKLPPPPKVGLIASPAPSTNLAAPAEPHIQDTTLKLNKVIVPAPTVPAEWLAPGKMAEHAKITSAAPSAAPSQAPADEAEETPTAIAPSIVIKKAGVPNPFQTAAQAKNSANQSDSVPPQASASPPVATITAEQLAAIKAQLHAELSKEFSQKESEMKGQLQKYLEAEHLLRQYAETAQSRLSYANTPASTPVKSIHRTPPRSQSMVSENAVIAPLDVPNLVGAFVAGSSLPALQSHAHTILTFKLLVSLPKNENPARGSFGWWLKSKLTLPTDQVAGSGTSSSFSSTWTSAKSIVNLSVNNPFNAKVEWLRHVDPSTLSSPMLSTIIKQISVSPEETLKHSVPISMELRGTQGLLFTMPPPEPSQNSSFWHDQRKRLTSTLACLSRPTTLLILYMAPSADISDPQTLIASNMALSQPPTSSQLDRFLILPLCVPSLSSTLYQAQASEQLEEILTSFASICQPNPSIRTCPVAALMETPVEALVSKYASSYRHTLETHKASLRTSVDAASGSLQNGHSTPTDRWTLAATSALVNDWNQLLGELYGLSCADALSSVDWPAPETISMYPQVADFGWPSADWNTQKARESLGGFLFSFVLDSPFDINGLDSTSEYVLRYVQELVARHPRLQGFEDHAQAIIGLHEERLVKATTQARVNGLAPVLLPFPLHALFEQLFSFLMEQQSQLVALPEEQLPSKDTLRRTMEIRRDRQLGESETWTSWYLSLCPDADSIRRKNAEIRRQQSGSVYAEALMSQFSSSNESSASLASSSASLRKVRRSLDSVELNGSRMVSSLASPSRATELSTPLLTPQRSLASSPSPSVSGNSSSPFVDRLHERLKSLVTRIQGSGNLETRQQSSKRPAADDAVLLTPYAPKRRALGGDDATP